MGPAVCRRYKIGEEVETEDPGGDDEEESIWPGGHDDEELTESGGQIEAEAPPIFS